MNEILKVLGEPFLRLRLMNIKTSKPCQRVFIILFSQWVAAADCLEHSS